MQYRYNAPQEGGGGTISIFLMEWRINLSNFR